MTFPAELSAENVTCRPGTWRGLGLPAARLVALLTNKTGSPDGKPLFVVDWVKVWRKG